MLFAALSIGLMWLDSRLDQGEQIRIALSAVIYPVQVAVDLPIRVGRWTQDRIKSRRQLREENLELRTRQLLMEAQMLKLAALEAENARLRELLESTSRMGERLSVAEILALDLDPYRQRITINRGRINGVFVGQPLIDAQGITGQITEIGLYTSTALLITDTSHSIPIEVNRNGLRTLAVGTGERDRLALPYLPNNADIEVGDLLVASGLGGRFPRGYPVGIVYQVERNPSERFADISALVSARLDRSREVLLVWTNQMAVKRTESEPAPAGEVKPSP